VRRRWSPRHKSGTACIHTFRYLAIPPAASMACVFPLHPSQLNLPLPCLGAVAARAVRTSHVCSTAPVVHRPHAPCDKISYAMSCCRPCRALHRVIIATRGAPRAHGTRRTCHVLHCHKTGPARRTLQRFEDAGTRLRRYAVRRFDVPWCTSGEQWSTYRQGCVACERSCRGCGVRSKRDGLCWCDRLNACVL
jgi:hypothetical protein